MVAAEVMHAVEHLFAVVGEVKHNGVIVLELLAQLCEHVVVEARGVVVVCHYLFLVFVQVGAVLVVVGGENHVFWPEAFVVFLVLPDAVEDDEIVVASAELVYFLHEVAVVEFAEFVAVVEA